MDTQHYGLALFVADRAVQALAEGAGPGLSRAVAVAADESEQAGAGRLATTRRLVGAAMIRTGERLKGRPQSDAAYSS